MTLRRGGTGSKDGLGVGAGGGGSGGTTHFALVITLLPSRVTVPFCANTLPSTLAVVPSPMDVRAKMFPLKVESAPSVAELPTCQKTLQAWAPPVRFTTLAPAVVSEEPAWNIQTSVALPFKVSVPVMPIVDGEL